MSLVASETSELLTELHGLCDRLPVPQSGWHPYVAQIAACRSDFERSLDLAIDWPKALELVAGLLESSSEPSFDEDTTPELSAAWQRLQTLPLPDGQHPYLDDILPALVAHRLLLVALSRTVSA